MPPFKPRVVTPPGIPTANPDAKAPTDETRSGRNDATPGSPSDRDASRSERLSERSSLHSRPGGAARHGDVKIESVTCAELVAQHMAGTSARPVSADRRKLEVRGLEVATVGPDPACITPVCAVSSRELPVVEILAALAAQDPSGVLVIESADRAFAFALDRGSIVSARGNGPLDRLEPFVAEVHRRHPERFGVGDLGPDAPAWMSVARTFVEERVLDQLQLCREPGARMTLVRGDVEWAGTRLAPGTGPTLRHALLEHARRWDEQPRIIKALGPLDRVAVPLREPGPSPAPKPPAPRGGDEAEDGWDFFDDPDPAAVAEWEDAVRVWSVCDGESTLQEIIDTLMIGDFRAMTALYTLAREGHLVFVDPTEGSRRRAAALANKDLAPVIQMRPDPPERTPAPGGGFPGEGVDSDFADVSDPGISSTSYAMVLKSARRRPRSRDERPVPRPPEINLKSVVDVATPAAGDGSATSSRSDGRGTFAVDTAVSCTEPAEQAARATSCAESTHENPGADATEDEPAAKSTIAERSVAAARAIDRALPSPRAMMTILATTAAIAVLATLGALLS